MKIWPFDEFAEKSHGHYISQADLETGVQPFRLIREAVGDAMDVIAELHSKWDLPNAVKIARALEPYAPAWIEDPLRMDSLDALARFAGQTTIPMAASETVGPTSAFHDLIDRSGVQVVLFDPAWVGGITEARKIAALADTRHLPVAVHDCAGPLNYVVGVHLSCSLPNAFVQESVRAFYRGWYTEIVTELPPVHGGQVRPTEGSGLGTECGQKYGAERTPQSRRRAAPSPHTEVRHEASTLHPSRDGRRGAHPWSFSGRLLVK